jgi:hypothetical protein
MNLSKYRIISIIFSFIILLSSCQATQYAIDIIKSNNKLISKLEQGYPKDTFYLYLNPYNFSEKKFFNTYKNYKTNPLATEILIKDSDRIEVIYLYTQTQVIDNFVEKNEITPILFLNNKFLGKGWTLYDSISAKNK